MRGRWRSGAAWLWLLLALLGANRPLAAAPLPPPADPLAALRAVAAGPVELGYNPHTGLLDFVSARVQSAGSTPEQRAGAFLRRYGALFGLRNPASELGLLRSMRDQAGMQHVVYQQQYTGVPVFGARLVVHLDRTGAVTAVNGQFQPAVALATVRPSISAAVAQQRLLAQLALPALAWQAPARLVIWTHNQGGAAARLAWELRGLDERAPARWHAFVDAHSGTLLLQLDELGLAGRDRRTYSAGQTTSLPGTLLCQESDLCTEDTIAQGAHLNAATVYTFYQETFGRDSFDDQGAPITSTVHYGDRYNNAFWNGAQLVYGDGDGQLYSPLAVDLDIVAHEWTHALTEATAGLFYEGESGALNESYSDVFAVLVNPTNWRIAELSYTPELAGDALRDLADPTMHGRWNPADPLGSLGQPDHMDSLALLPSLLDNGGVHINSGIPNKASYLMTAGGTFRGITITGVGFAKAAQIIYRAHTVYNTPFTNFAGAARNTYQACQDLLRAGLYDIGGADCVSVRNAWAAVGLGPREGQNQRLWLPLLAANSQAGLPGLYGQVTLDGRPSAGRTLALYRCDQGADVCGLVSSATTDVRGGYRLAAPALPAGSSYYVRFAQDTAAPNCRLWGEWQNRIGAFAGGVAAGGDFDLRAVAPLAPGEQASGPQITFRWTARSLPAGMPGDLPSLLVLDGAGTTTLYQSNPPLARGTTTATIGGFAPGNYLWAVQVYGPGGVGFPACAARLQITAAAQGRFSEPTLVVLPGHSGQPYPPRLPSQRLEASPEA